MDTYSAYLTLTAECIDDLVTPELQVHYFRHRCEWLPSECCKEHQNEYVSCRLSNRPWTGVKPCCKARKANDKRTPGLFKVVRCGDGFVGLCSKTYYCFGATDKHAFLDVITNRRSVSGKSREFRVRHSTVLTYVQERAALTYFYAKRVVHEDGVSMSPVDM